MHSLIFYHLLHRVRFRLGSNLDIFAETGSSFTVCSRLRPFRVPSLPVCRGGGSVAPASSLDAARITIPCLAGRRGGQSLSCRCAGRETLRSTRKRFLENFEWLAFTDARVDLESEPANIPFCDSSRLGFFTAL